MKFLIYSNAPTVATGYGVQCAQLATRLMRDGHDVAVAATYGHQVGVVNWPTEYGPVKIYPSGRLENSIDIVLAHADHFFEGDRDAGWIIILNDVWALRGAPFEQYKVLAWTPVDHFPAPEGVVKFFHKTNATPIAMSRYGEKQLIDAGLNPLYAPLAVDTTVFKPTFRHNDSGKPGREVFGIPNDAFVVLMVAMNKDPMDRKGFNEGFRAFAAFWREHQDAVLVVHSNWSGNDGSGINLRELARHAAIPPHALIFTDLYALVVQFNASWLAALYTAADVLLSPSKGEGFGVPMIEAQACGTPVVASAFTAQTELLGPGWGVGGQLTWDAPQAASYLTASQNELCARLMTVYEADLPAIAEECRSFALEYDADRVFETYWKPIIDSLEPAEPIADKPIMDEVQVIVPLTRKENFVRLVKSFEATAPETAHLLLGDVETANQCTYAENVNAAYAQSRADWVLIVGDDVEFKPGWFEAAQKLSDRYDVIGTNDTDGPVKNPLVANGSHADHFFVRRSYIEDEGASLEGPGVLAPEVYSHWWTDKEIIELAKARGAFTPCLDSVIVHHHPGYDGREDLRAADPVYMKAAAGAEKDRETWLSRVPHIQALRVRS